MFKELCIHPDIDKSCFSAYQYAQNIGSSDELSRDKQNTIKLALLTAGEDINAYSTFRNALYEMSCNFKQTEFIDLGCIKGDSFGIAEVVDNLRQKGILSIVLSQDTLLPYTLINSFSNQPEPIQLSVFESRMDYSRTETQKYLLDYLLPLYPERLSHLYWLGYQSYFVDPAVLSLMEEKYFETDRLGNLHRNIEKTEPVLRDSNAVALHLSSIRFADAPATILPNSNGFSANEVCQIMRYIGMSDRPSVIGLYGYRPEDDCKSVTAQLLAQMIWYLTEGFYQRRSEFPPKIEELTRYEVQLPVGQLPVAFFKSNKSERWWFYIGDMNIKSADLDPQRLLSCSYDDYLKTCEGDIPDRLLKALQRFD